MAGNMTDVSAVQISTGQTGQVVSITIRYFAAARAASGVDEEALSIASPASVATTLEAAVALHGDDLARVLGRCSYLHNSVAVHEHSSGLEHGDQLDVLPPFAGG